MKLWLIGALMVAMLATAPAALEAKRLAGGKSAGMQRNMPARTAPDALPANPSPAQQATPGAPAPAPAAAPALPPKRNWLGPLAGLAAGLGLGALLSQLGMGQGLAGALVFALLAAALVLGVIFVRRRFGAGASGRAPMLAGAAAGAGGSQGAWSQAPTPQPRTWEPVPALTGEPAAGVSAPAPVKRVFVPASFDSAAFARTAKMIFIRLQTAHDTADLDDLRRFTTPELFASIRMDILERGNQPQQTDVVEVEAEVLDVADEAAQQVVSVRFHGRVVEEQGAAPTDFNEVWHLVKPLDDSRTWAIAGIEQLA